MGRELCRGLLTCLCPIRAVLPPHRGGSGWGSKASCFNTRGTLEIASVEHSRREIFWRNGGAVGQNVPFRVAKRHVSGCETGRFRVRNGLFCRLVFYWKRNILYCLGCFQRVGRCKLLHEWALSCCPTATCDMPPVFAIFAAGRAFGCKYAILARLGGRKFNRA